MPSNMPPPPGAYPVYGGPPYNPYGMAPPAPRNGLGTAGMVLGIISIVVFLLSWIAAIIGILAIIFGAIGRKRAKQGLATNRGHATAGLVCGIIGTVLGIIILIIGAWFINKTKTCQENYPDLGPAYTQCVRNQLPGNN
jgi:uncharacterized membrane protein